MNTPDRMHILFSTDSGYAMPMTVSVTSIFENNADAAVTIHVLYSTLTEDQKTKLLDLAEQYGQEVNLVHVDEHYFNDVPALRWSKETYYRLLISELLPASISRILYLDCDIIVNKSLSGLYGTDLGGKSIAMLPEDQNAEAFSKRLGLSSGLYFQAGVILFDMSKVRPVLSYRSSLYTLSKIGSRLVAVDQDVVNVMFDGEIAALPKKFNNCDITNFNGSALGRLLNAVDENELKDTTIFHFATGKPWNNLYSGSCERLWYSYLKLSPYASLHADKYGRIWYRILRTGPFKALFFGYIHFTPIINKAALSLLPKAIYRNMRQLYRSHIK